MNENERMLLYINPTEASITQYQSASQMLASHLTLFARVLQHLYAKEEYDLELHKISLLSEADRAL